MAQVAARISSEHEQWLKECFRTKSAGAEFLVPWAVDTFFRSLRQLRGLFSTPELLTLLGSHKDMRLMPEQTRLPYLMLRVQDACDLNRLHMKYGADQDMIEKKLRQLSDTQATALMIWASAYWVSKQWKETDMREYIRDIGDEVTEV